MVVLLVVGLSVGEGLGGEAEAEVFEESLRLKSLPSRHIYAFFQFRIREKELSNFSRLFPRTLTEVLVAHSVHELHFTLTQGHWRTESWGQGLSPAPSGAHVRAWFTSPSNQ